MSVIEMFRLKNRDERLLAETNRINAIGFYILSAGILLDLYYGMSQMQVAFMHDMEVEVSLYVRPLEYLALMGAMITCLIISIKRGVMTNNRFANTEHFPWEYYLVWSGLGALGVGLGTALFRALAEYRVLGAGQVHWLGNGALGLVCALMVFFLCIGAYYLSFKIAKRQADKQVVSTDSE
ncbi:MAG: hypothetical protein FWG23_08070 [Eggerthellaceae bacterium]|jgi:hypothetical protein|nr:hypothetical protein [Eggerthellaceae bacterium]MDR2716183.1 hypothetical protein [Coriobacteriaceae bacterium]